jgi:hypothetical protein
MEARNSHFGWLSSAPLEEERENYLAFLHLACAQLIFAKVLIFG